MVAGSLYTFLSEDNQLTGHEIRDLFLQYFNRNGHRIVKSSSLVPADDPTLLFTNAGMNQFKDVFLGRESRDYKRAATSQKCVRAGGKHNDLENVGKTARHHTFFEMLGNFSFGDYFKVEAIPFAWSLVTGQFGLTSDRLWITVFRDDEEAFEIWHRSMNVPLNKIFRLDEKDNFWAMGDTGPCGPCSEIHYDQGPSASERGHTACDFPCDCGRYVEIWNLVFMQFDRDSSGRLSPLPRPSIDTGMGLERIASILQGKSSTFETDLLKPLILDAANLAQKEYGQDPNSDVSLRVIADHSRAAAFLISDGVIPSNDGRGYVLRKILRRAIRHGRFLGLNEPFLFQMTASVSELMKAPYPELLTTRDYVGKVVKNEEQRFSSTIRIAIDQFSDVLSKSETTSNGKRVLPGATMFRFYDTFGLPLDLMQELASEVGVTLDEEGFNERLNSQRERGKSSWKEVPKEPGSVVSSFGAEKTEFLGYTKVEVSPARVVAIRVNNIDALELGAGQTGDLFLDRTPFYAETGGQLGDTGILDGDNFEAFVQNTYLAAPGHSAHETKCLKGTVRVGETLRARVDAERRASIAKNHTATHLLHASLRNLIGFHVKQAGSLVAPDRLRFDFSHYASLSSQEIAEIENMVNAAITRNFLVTTSIKDLDEATSEGAMALFGEKYGSQVRVVSINAFSKELCGGTHVHQTGDIGLFKVTGESGIAAGIRRIEAITGDASLSRFREDERLICELEETLRGKRDDLIHLIEKSQASLKALEKEVDELRYRIAKDRSQELFGKVLTVKDVKILTGIVDGLDKSGLRNLADELKARLERGVVVLGTAAGDKVVLVASVSSNVSQKVHAGKMIKTLSAIVGGSGGGRPEMAEAGGKDSSRLNEALQAVGPWVSQALES